MKKKDEDAFLRSVLGALPIKEKNKIKKDIPVLKRYIQTKKILKNTVIKSITEPNKNIQASNFFKLEKTTINKKLKKGKIPIDKKIDFHGMSALDAEELFFNTVLSCYKKNLRCILFVTGKGVLKKKNNENEKIRLYYGKIREMFFSWINNKKIQKYLLSVEQASIEYGADGAFFVYLRKQKTKI